MGNLPDIGMLPPADWERDGAPTTEDDAHSADVDPARFTTLLGGGWSARAVMGAVSTCCMAAKRMMAS